ncbi:DUF202 domain-containing protein [Nocardia brasiliensis]|uniref:DUF202 domain-containing protein n=1 Tax=Nocardia brasiliensis TaxID=37326 RepID=A0A6G9XWB1_NOCBR|nr:DUF202 domain-containing protein [Nocardia brasiliensis]QIS05209.1 DUF202 domain-containing protein [Nocardia brasiliensis]
MSRAGLAAERTALAWRRTAVAAMITGALFLNHAVANQWRPAVVAPIGAALAMVVLAGTCYFRNRSLRLGRVGRGGSVVAVATTVVVAVAVLAAVVAITDPWP